MSTHVVQCLSNPHFLHTVLLLECHVTSRVQSELQSNDLELPVYNLRLWVSPRTPSMWNILPLCPGLCTLSVLSPLKNVYMPSVHIWSRCRFFPHLERLCVNNTHSTSTIPLADVLRAAATASGLHSTHFKLHTRRGVCDSDVHILLDSIQEALIKILALEGLAETEPPLFGRIAEIYEQTLVALTLVWRASDRQLQNQSVVWPHLAWEYTPHLSRLVFLKYFDWNSACEYMATTTSILHTFKQNFPLGYAREGEDGYIESLDLDVLPFAALCPSLETFTSHKSFSRAAFISRTNAGPILAKSLNRAESSIQTKCDIDQWNPSIIFGHAWPHIIPKSTDTELDGISTMANMTSSLLRGFD